MKNKYRVSLSSVILLLIFTAVAITAVFVVQGNETRLLNRKLGHGFLSENAITFSVPENAGNSVKILNYLQNNKNNKLTLLGENGGSRLVWSNGSPDSPPMLSGRYFSSEELSGGAKTAVIGQNWKTKVVSNSGKDYITVEGELFEVVGVMGHPTRLSSLDSMVFFNGSAFPVEVWEQFTKLTLDGGFEVPGVYQKLKQTLAMDGIELKTIDSSKALIDVLLNENGKENLIYGGMLFSFILASVTVSMEWVWRKRRLFAVKRLIGVGKTGLTLELTLRYFLLAFSGTCIGLVAGIILQGKGLNLMQIGLVLLITIVCGWISTFPAITKMSRLPVAEVIRA